MEIRFFQSFKYNKKIYHTFTKLNDTDYGFSIQRNYSEKIKRKLKSKKNECVCLIYLWLDEKKLSNNIIPIIVKIVIFRNGKVPASENYFYKINKKIIRPINIISQDGFFYDKKNHLFLNRKKVKISANEILDNLYNQHIKIYSLLKGLPIKIKIFVQILILLTLKILIELLNAIFNLIKGKKIIELKRAEFARNINSKYIQNENDKYEIAQESKDSIKFFYFKTSKRAVIIFCVINIVLYVLFLCFNYKPAWIQIILKYNLLSICYVIVSIIIIDHLLPNLILKIEELLSDLRFKVNTWKLKI